MSLNAPTPNRTPKAIYNPLYEDFSCDYATDDNPPITYTIHAVEIETFPTYLADHIAKHLAQRIVAVRGIQTNYDDDFKKTMDEITNIDLKI